jgi:3-oxoacyl-[acyl-carrier-protein] synthase II
MDIVITGMGVISSVGSTVESYIENLARGTVAIGPAPWPTPHGAPPFFAQVPDFEPADWLAERTVTGTDRFAQFAVAAASGAVEMAGLAQPDPLRTAVTVGTSMGGLSTLSQAQHGWDADGPDGLPRNTVLKIWPNMAAAQITLRYGLHGPSLTTCTACASSIDAIGVACGLIAGGTVDMAITGGSEGWSEQDFTPAWVAAQATLGMTEADPDPKLACRPFDADRVGIVNGEGAAMFVLESAEHARARGARALGWIRGYGSLADGYHPSAPAPSGEWETMAMRAALRQAGMEPGDVSAVIAHGTGTPKGDSAEIRAINALFGDDAARVLVTSIKGSIGHCAGASGALSLAAAVAGMERDLVVPTAGTLTPDPEAEFDLVTGSARRGPVHATIVNAFGFGGQNASLVVADRPG